ncbi:MAG: GntR family transcriptional regulator [Paludibacter sp.]|nr:GntR family transcriptional regulator [Paludibacter sp.]
MEKENNRSKVQQLVEKITRAISEKVFAEGDTLPSINTMSNEQKLSRDTVYKAYQKLKDKGIVEAAPTRGYYVRETINRVFVLLDVFSSYKNDLYNQLIANLPLNYHIDLYFYQSNEKLFNSLITDSAGKYDLYIVTNFKNDVYYNVLDRLDNSRVLLLDLGKFPKQKFSYICQDFDDTLYDCLTCGLDLFKKYSEFRFVFPLECEHPESCIPHYKKFCTDNLLKHKLIRRKLEISDIEKDTVYLLPRHSDVVDFVKICRSKNLKLGKDIGLVTFNDTPMLEVIENGISAISTDFMQMGKLAAEYITTREKTQTYVASRLIVRGSL